ncbi:hypothetical protein [Polyangium mundeleinium]|uniref:DUF4334 domain-containing protein n=1 Tax=Polyangium mundeleinium TaxID=2995306 RepID=A0ABT5EX84_9BACT|nr:hypothetical protein [Polyangium mundeleinium]MDC0745979.1 hypothetical protein [Polyangium mundeleinium]
MNTEDFLKLSHTELRSLLERGHPIDPSALDGSEYRGVSLGLPAPIVAITWLTFRKTFHRDPKTGALRGWNVRMQQAGLDGPREPMRDAKGKPRCFGFYEVGDGRAYDMPVAARHGLVIDYNRARENPRFDPIRLGRDPLVSLDEGRVDRLLGWTYLDLGLARVNTPSYFLLEREGPLSYVP